MLGYIDRRDAALLGVLLAVCLCLGSAFDYRLSCALFDPASLFGRTVEAVGELPFELAASAAGVMLVRVARAGRLGDRGRGGDCDSDGGRALNGPHNRGGRCALVALGVLLNVALLAYEVIAVVRAGGRLVVVLSALSIAATVAMNVLVYRMTRDAAPAELLRWAAMVLAVCAVQMVVLNLAVKPVWSRPRMRVIAATPGLEFQPWWVIGQPHAAEFIASGVIKDGFRSFASGHTAHAATGLMFAALPAAVLKRAPRRRRLIFWTAVAVTAVVALGRIVAGAHFLSDVTCGFALMFALELLGARIAYPRGVQ